LAHALPQPLGQIGLYREDRNLTRRGKHHSICKMHMWLARVIRASAHHGMYIRIELPLAATVKVVCHHCSRRRHTTHDPSKLKSPKYNSQHCYSGLLASKYRWHGNCHVHGCPAGGGGLHAEGRNWSTVSENLVTQAACRCFA